MTLGPTSYLGSAEGRACPSPSALDGGSLEISLTVQVCLPSVQLPSSTRGSDMAIVCLVDGGNLS